MANILMISPFLWEDKMPANSKEMAVSLSANHKVVYINFSLDIKSVLLKKDNFLVKNRLENRGKTLNINSNLTVYQPKHILLSINWIKNSGIYNVLNKLNNRIFAKDIKKALNQFNGENYILFVDNMIARCEHLPKLLKPKEFWYYSRDYLFTQAYFKAHQEKQEINLIKTATKVFANSQVLTQRAKQWNSNSFYLPQGISNTSNHSDTANFNPNNYPALVDFLEDPSKVKLCFYGIITPFRVNTSLMLSMLDRKPEYDILMIGRDADNVLGELHNYPNLHYQPWLSPDEIKGIVPKVDILINPQLKNDYTNANSPRKLLEYLSFGKPVIVTETDFIKDQKPPVKVANTVEEFLLRIEECVREKDNDPHKQVRLDYSKKFHWDEVLKVLDAHWPKN